MEMLENGVIPEKIMLQSGVDAVFASKLRALAKNLGVQVQTVPWQKLNSVTRKQHQGVVAFKSWVQYQNVLDVVHLLFDQGKDPLLLMLDHITDVRNLGAIARSAEVFGVHGLVIPATGSAMINGEAVKTSAGALMHLAVCKERSLGGALEELHDLGLRSYGADVHADVNLPDLELSGPSVIVLGAEDKGISKELLQLIHHPFRIPQTGQTESLNVSVAAGIVLYQTQLHRLIGPT